jgi:hypothetical protein
MCQSRLVAWKLWWVDGGRASEFGPFLVHVINSVVTLHTTLGLPDASEHLTVGSAQTTYGRTGAASSTGKEL